MRSFAVLVLVAACGGGEPARPDAAGPVDAPESDAPAFPACAEFAGSAIGVPAHVTETLAGADVVSPSGCAAVDAPFGVESAGPDKVIPLRGLVPGTAYIVRVTSASDLAFYVVSGCATETGPGDDQCMLFQDGSTGDRELGRFVAESATAYVVVDYYESQPPASLAFTLDVYAEECQGEGTVTACGGQTPACFEGQCVGCVSSFDCPTAAASVCGSDQMCEAGADACALDDLTEPADDGPAGAPLLALDAQGAGSITARICSSPRTESDFVAFDVTTLGETWDFQLVWTGGRDLDLRVFGADGDELAMSFWEQPERARLTYLPLGRYYLRVREFDSSPDTAPVTYTLTAQRTFGTACTDAADCAAEYRNQVFRGSCFAGACVAIDGDGAVPEGGRCDSQNDCADGLSCPSFYFVADSDTRESCERGCTSDASCDEGFVCTTYFSNNFCVPKCTEADHCPTSLNAAPSAGPWKRLSCDVPTGRCQP